MKIDPHCLQQKRRPITLVSGDIRYTQISAGFLGERIKQALYTLQHLIFSGYFFKNFRDKASMIRNPLPTCRPGSETIQVDST